MENEDTSLEAAIEKIKAMDMGTMTMKTSNRYNIGPATNSAAGSITLQGETNAQAGLTVRGKPVDLKPFHAEPTMEMLEDASSAYNVEPETLSNLWVARFGKGWVGNEVVEDMEADQVDWWRHAANRLRELGYLEMHTLASSYRVVLRIVE